MDIPFLTFSSSSPRVSALDASTCALNPSTSASYFLRSSLAVSHELNGAVTIAAIMDIISGISILISQSYIICSIIPNRLQRPS
nr:MAG TPA: hypothetical protein [Caudoviricetes sp.]